MDDVVADVRAPPKLESDELWFKDAIIYQLHVKAFADSNSDGIGDFAGLTEKLDYLEDLGVGEKAIGALLRGLGFPLRPPRAVERARIKRETGRTKSP